MTSETRRTLAFLGWLLLACLICWTVVIAIVWLFINLLYFMGSVLVPVPVY